MRPRTLALLPLLLLLACGDGVVLLSFNAGTVAGDADCRDGRGDFELRNQGGLLLLIIIGDDTTIILANGFRGRCADIRAGASAQVRGTDQGGRIMARDITLG